MLPRFIRSSRSYAHAHCHWLEAGECTSKPCNSRNTTGPGWLHLGLETACPPLFYLAFLPVGTSLYARFADPVLFASAILSWIWFLDIDGVCKFGIPEPYEPSLLMFHVFLVKLADSKSGCHISRKQWIETPCLSFPQIVTSDPVSRRDSWKRYPRWNNSARFHDEWGRLASVASAVPCYTWRPVEALLRC